MTIKATDRIVVRTNGYDGDSPDKVFEGQVGTVADIKDGNPMVFYIAFENPEVNKRTDEDPNTTWPFYVDELEKVDA